MTKPSEQSTLTQQTVTRLLELIEEMNLQVGDFLPTEAVLIEKFGISRIILREALSYLKGLGLINSRRGSGFKIAEVDFVELFSQVFGQITYFSGENFEELFTLRRTLELGSIEDAVRNATGEEIEEICDLSRRLSEMLEDPSATSLEFLRLDLRFHETIMRPAKCRLLNVLNHVIYGYFIKKRRSIDEKRPASKEVTGKRTALEHSVIASAFRLHQPEVAFACLKNHLRFANTVENSQVLTQNT